MEPKKKRSYIEISYLPERDAYRVRFQAGEEVFHDVVRDLKKIDFQRRSYNSTLRFWTVSAEEFETLRTLALKYFDNAQLVTGNAATDLHTGRTTNQLTLFS